MSRPHMIINIETHIMRHILSYRDHFYMIRLICCSSVGVASGIVGISSIRDVRHIATGFLHHLPPSPQPSPLTVRSSLGRWSQSA